MGGLLFLFYPWGVILQAIAIVHFIWRRPDTYWLWIIIVFGGIGALIYIFAEVVPDAGILREAFHGVSRFVAATAKCKVSTQFAELHLQQSEV